MSTILQMLVLFGAVMLTGTLVLYSRIGQGKAQKLLLAFSGAFILAISFFHLLPEAYSGSASSTHIGMLIFAGFMLQLILDYFSGGVEHGHVHHESAHHHGHHEHHDHASHAHGPHPGMKRFPYLMMLGLCIHAFVEGLPLMNSEAGNRLYTGILLHNIPIALTLTQVFVMAGRRPIQVLGALSIFGCMTPLGALSAQWLATDLHEFSHAALALVIGVFFHLSTTILFESDQNHRFNLIKFVTIIAGAGAAFLLS